MQPLLAGTGDHITGPKKIGKSACIFLHKLVSIVVRREEGKFLRPVRFRLEFCFVKLLLSWLKFKP